jgi:hypothetical protein
MSIDTSTLGTLFDLVVTHIEIPISYYERAAARHRSLCDWLVRDQSLIARFDPDIRPQGSFRYGTVIRPLRADDEYDLDNVCLLRTLSKASLTQKQLKDLYGYEIKGYAKANGMIKPVEEHNRCWRLRYSDEVAFHLDTLPCIPEDEAVQRLIRIHVPNTLAARAVAITDRRHPSYEQISPLWPSSNPRGFAAWFEARAARGVTMALGEAKARATIEEVPTYGWKTALQQSIQLMKRHRDVMFSESPDLAPISMIITNLAAHAYEGETGIATALTAIVEKMTDFVQPGLPRVPNPADPAEDYADKWARNPQLEWNFRGWHENLKADLARLATLPPGDALRAEVRKVFRVDLTQEEVRELGGQASPGAIRVAPVIIRSGPKPWGHVR